jgi:hypothetical protein
VRVQAAWVRGSIAVRGSPAVAERRGIFLQSGRDAGRVRPWAVATATRGGAARLAAPAPTVAVTKIRNGNDFDHGGDDRHDHDRAHQPSLQGGRSC